MSFRHEHTFGFASPAQTMHGRTLLDVEVEGSFDVTVAADDVYLVDLSFDGSLLQTFFYLANQPGLIVFNPDTDNVCLFVDAGLPFEWNDNQNIFDNPLDLSVTQILLVNFNADEAMKSKLRMGTYAAP